MVRTADAVVIGGGIHGCSCALHLARRGISVVVVEKDHVGRHASGVNAGGVRRLGRALPEIPLSVAAMGLWHNIAELVDDDCQFVPSGQVRVAENGEEARGLEERASLLRDAGFNHEVVIGREELRDLLPAVSPHCVGGMVVVDDGHANPYRTTMAFKRKAESLGVRVLEQVRVLRIAKRQGTWRVDTSTDPLDVPVLINCAGAWGDSVAVMLGEPVPMQAYAPMLMITARMPFFVKPVVGAQGRTLSLKQFANGTVLIGGGVRGNAVRTTNTASLEFGGLSVNARTAAQILPTMRGARIVRCWAGIEGYMPDGIPVIGPGRQEGVFHAFGFSAHGFQLGPIVGSIIADLVTTGATAHPIGPFRIDRFDSPPQRQRDALT